MSATLDVAELNAADAASFAAAVGPLFEDAPGFLAALAAGRPFTGWDALFTTARAVAHAAPIAVQVELIDAHPRLGAPPASVSALSFREQGYDRAASGDQEAGATARTESDLVAAELDSLNAAYESRFGFRYCVHVAGRSRKELLPEMRAALDGDPDAERHRALDAVVDIAIARRAAILGPRA